ncbi:tape measure protein [Bifidobacterium amazonense]|uniref:Tape measure protein n=1 Tax=Bifidobacterium amazonense TaxID=2809027 RepID=A0ABS9VUB5_9BIFI|nr:tape measure protein [Bifidobacterium amazonense]MCH9275679.1 tape measure protein [Bifidobacterium amazonense]
MASLATAWVDIVPRFKDLSSTFSKELRGVDAAGAGTKLGSQLGDGLTVGAKSGGTSLANMFTGVTKSAVTGFGKIGKIGLGAITTIGGGITALAAKGGFSRALNIENAQAKLKGLGHSAQEITEIMSNANAAVKGTAFGLDEAATVAASAVASGIKPGEQLTKVLKTVGDTAQIAGMGFSDAGAIFTSVMARGKLQGDDMLQLTSRGVPVLQALSDQLGVSTQDVSGMVSEGEVDFQTFATAMDKYLGGAALAAGETFSGALSNVKAALSRLGQKAATPALNALRDTFNVLTPAIDKVNTALQPLADELGSRLSNAVKTVTPWIQRFADGMEDGSISIQDIAKQVGLLVGAFAGFTAIGQYGPQILDVFTAAGDGAGNLVSAVTGNMDTIKGVVSGAGGIFSDLGTRWGNALGLVDANFGGIFGLMSNRVKSGLSGVGSTLVGMFDSRIYVPLQQGIGGIGSKIAAPFQALAGKVGGFLSPVTSAFGTAFQGFGSTLAGPIQSGLSGIGNMFLNFFNPANFLKYFGIAAIIGALVVALGALNESLGGQLQTHVTEFLTVKLPGYITEFQNWVTTQLPVLMQSGLTLLTSVLQGITQNLPQILTVAADILTSLVDGIANALPTLLPIALEMILTLVQGIIDNLPKIINSGLNLLTKFVEGILNALPKLIEALPKIITGFVDGILAMLPQILTTGVELLLKFITGIIDAIPQLVAALPQIISGFINGIGKHLPRIIETGLTLLVKLVVGVIKAIPQLVAALPQIIKAIWDGLTNVDWGGLGRNIIQGIKNGLMNAGNAIKDAIVGLAKSAWSAVKSFFGIASPSKLMRDTVGVMVGRGLANGIIESTKTVTDAATNLSGSAFDAFDKAAYGKTFDFDGTMQLTNVTGPMELTHEAVAPSTREDKSAQLTKDDIIQAVAEALQTMPAMRLLLDNGVMAGQLAPAIDKALGNRKARGY